MIYLVSQKISTFGMLEYSSGKVLGRDDFWQGISHKAFEGTLHYRLKKRSDAAKLARWHIIESAAGPLLVSSKFRAAIEREAPGDAEFLRTEIRCDDAISTDFYAMNLLNQVACVNMEKSEFGQINFDPSDPRYTFSYIVMNVDWDSSAIIASCTEQRNRFAVRESLKDACFRDDLQGLIFYQALDMTYGDRSMRFSIS